MENRCQSFLIRLFVLLMLGFSVQAAESGPSLEQEADWQQRLDHAAALLADGKARQAAADQTLEDAKPFCAGKFLVNACLIDARKAYVASSKAAKLLENEGKALERAVRKEQLSDRDQRFKDAAPQREADLQARQAEVRAERETSQAEQAATRAEKARKAEAGRQRHADDVEKYRQKQEAHDARVAKKMNETARRAAEASAPATE